MEGGPRRRAAHPPAPYPDSESCEAEGRGSEALRSGKCRWAFLVALRASLWRRRICPFVHAVTARALRARWRSLTVRGGTLRLFTSLVGSRREARCRMERGRQLIAHQTSGVN